MALTETNKRNDKQLRQTQTTPRKQIQHDKQQSYNFKKKQQKQMTPTETINETITN